MMSDPVHLIKKLNSSLDKSARCDDEAEKHTTRSIVKWEAIEGEEELMECPLSLRQMEHVWIERSKSNHGTLGLSYDRKYTLEHFRPTSASRMRVRPAAQNLSATMARWLGDDIAKGHTFNTALKKYCELCNEYFDIMNGKLGAVYGPSDPKLTKLVAFARWFEDWKHDLSKRGLSKKEQAASFITRECYDDLRMAVHGFVCMVKYYSAAGMPAENLRILPQGQFVHYYYMFPSCNMRPPHDVSFATNSTGH